jgi:hypothetical protein
MTTELYSVFLAVANHFFNGNHSGYWNHAEAS